MEVSSLARVLFRTLIYHSIQRCRVSETLCRLSVSLKTFQDNPPLLRISISDTGVGSSLEEFLKLDVYTSVISSEQWDGALSITTTGMNDKEIQHFCLNLNESRTSNIRLIKLPSTYKIIGTFSGTEVCFSIRERNPEEFDLWAVDYVKKVLLLKDPNIVFELTLESINGHMSRRDFPLHENNDTRAPLSLSSIKCMAFGLQEYSIKHGFTLPKECEICSSYRELLIEGNGVACNSERNRIRDQLRVEAVILVVAAKLQPSCWSGTNSTSQVFCFQDYAPSSHLDSCLATLSSLDWPSFGLRMKEAFVENEGKIVIEWEDTAFAFMHIAIHCYHKTAIPTGDISMPDRNLIKKAVKAALEDLKASNTHLFLSSQATKIREYVPDLSRSLANLILSSNDSEFKRECTTLLGLSSLQSNPEIIVESCISEKLARIIEANDKKSKAERGAVVPRSLFECGNSVEEIIDEETVEADEDYILGY
ncbi:Type 2 DNA topoisomerase 6 subunit B-like [Rhynchospora pubera]|uniref:Type 2 DNA topoisomerase 6 subunit B-like n=1 Tax=Rhynchospora pubera TaxID=906938 RepID=A0AAV8FYB5_9POAL|nr:Type 2 DNA topoisomerase 6 subunit B-like [Rhynchospora pubera]